MARYIAAHRNRLLIDEYNYVVFMIRLGGNCHVQPAVFCKCFIFIWMIDSCATLFYYFQAHSIAGCAHTYERLFMNTTANLTRSVQSMTVGKSNQNVVGLFRKADSELVKLYGQPAAMRIHADGQVERVWHIDSGELHVVHGIDGKATDVKFFNNITHDQMQQMVSQDQA